MLYDTLTQWVYDQFWHGGWVRERKCGSRIRILAKLVSQADIAANYFIPSQVISGPKSRDYDFLYGHGALMVHTYVDEVACSVSLAPYPLNVDVDVDCIVMCETARENLC